MKVRGDTANSVSLQQGKRQEAGRDEVGVRGALITRQPVHSPAGSWASEDQEALEGLSGWA